MDPWTILDAFFRDNAHFITGHHLTSFNEFVTHKLRYTIKSMNPFEMIKYHDQSDPSQPKQIQLRLRVYVGGKEADEISISYPTITENGVVRRKLFPNEARLKSLDYKTDLFADILVETTNYDRNGNEISTTTSNNNNNNNNDGNSNSNSKTFKNLKIGAIPVMVGSLLCSTHDVPRENFKDIGECKFDQGGYFIVQGKEKVIIAQERVASNRLFISTTDASDDRYSHIGMIRCTTEESAVFPKTIYFKVMYPIPQNKDVDPKVDQLKKRNRIVVKMPNIKNDIPLFILFRALGVTSDKAILQHILYDLAVSKDSENPRLLTQPGDLDGDLDGETDETDETDNNNNNSSSFSTHDPSNARLLDFIYASIIDNDAGVYTQNDALQYLGDQMGNANTTQVKYMLFHDLFPNLNVINLGNHITSANDSNTNTSGDVREKYANLSKKALFLGQLTHTLMRTCLGMEPLSDKDHYGYKRVDVSGFLCGDLFRDFYNLFRRKCLDTIDQAWFAKAWNETQHIVHENNKAEIFQSVIVENGMLASMRGKWGAEEDSNGRAQELSRLSYMGFLSHLRRVQSPVSATLKLVEPRRLHPTQWGAMCPSESPDGANIGLIKHLALLCHITHDTPSIEIIRVMRDLNMITFLEEVSFHRVGALMGRVTTIYLNNNWIGYTDNPLELTKALRKKRRTQEIHPMTSVRWDIAKRSVAIYSDAGRCCRPLLIIREADESAQNEPLGTKRTLVMDDVRLKGLNSGTMRWADLMLETDKMAAAIEFVDVSESEGCLIATSPNDIETYPHRRYTHCEIHPSTILAVLIANIPFADHNQAPRNYFSGAQGKQAVGVYNTQFNNRMDTTGLILHYPQKAIVNTRYMEYLHNNSLPNGENAIVAIMTYSGYNQEDSMIINKGSIERGMFNMTYYKTIVETEEYSLVNDDRIVFGNPEQFQKEGKTVHGFGKRFGNYTNLDEHGYPKLNAKIGLDDVYLGKVSIQTDVQTDQTSLTNKQRQEDDERMMNNINKNVYSDNSAIADKTMAFTVDKVYVYQDEMMQKQCKIRGRIPRLPTLGDKLASRHAQKGVIGMIMSQENMPFTKHGVVPDIIINPHAIPSRMTVGHLMECMFGKLGCISGQRLDATPFCNRDMGAAQDALEQLGFERYGDEILYSGVTGEQLKCHIFIGPTYMLRLKHMVSDKINYRGQDESGYEMLTHQPVASRGNEGGLRMGEMENNCINAHGAWSFMKESMFDRSDRYVMGIDKPIGDIAVMNFDKRNAFVASRGPEGDLTTNDFDVVAMPYATKLFIQELQTLGLRVHMRTDENENWDEEDDDDDHYFADDDELDGGGGGNVTDDDVDDTYEDEVVGKENEESSY
jgi:DNA-directed RNA polymerase II subunit RPB2